MGIFEVICENCGNVYGTWSGNWSQSNDDENDCPFCSENK